MEINANIKEVNTFILDEANKLLEQGNWIYLNSFTTKRYYLSAVPPIHPTSEDADVYIILGRIK